MAREREHYHDPLAPTATVVRPTVFAAVRETDGRLLLARRADTKDWELPGGKVDIGETVVAAVEREVEEETGIHIEVRGISGLYSDPGHVMVYANGEVRQEFAVCVHAVPISGEARPDHDEMSDVRWVDPHEVDELQVHPAVRLRIGHALSAGPAAWLG